MGTQALPVTCLLDPTLVNCHKGHIYISKCSSQNKWKSNKKCFRNIYEPYSLRAIPSPSLVLIKWSGQKRLSGQHTGLKRVVWPNLWTFDLKINMDYLLIGRNTCIKFCIDQVKRSKHFERTTHSDQEWFDLDLWTCELKINRDHLL